MKITAKSLKAWNSLQNKPFGISANENWNASVGLPCAEARKFLRQLHSAKYGICYPSARLTMADVKNALSA